jgi:hypothetical protein
LGQAGASGFVSDSRGGWLPRSLPGWIIGFIVGASTLFGAFAVLVSTYWALFARPTVSLELQQVGVLNALEDRPFSLPVDVGNEHPKATCNVRIKASSDLGPLRVRPWALSGLASGENRTVSVSGSSSKPGRHSVRVEASAQGGWFTPFARTAQTTAEVMIWRRRSVGAFAADAVVGQTCSLLASLEVGEAQVAGLRCEASVVQPKDLRFRAVTSPYHRDWEDPRLNLMTPGKETMLLRWQMDPLPSYTDVPVRIHIVANPPRLLQKAECEDLASRVSWSCVHP